MLKQTSNSLLAVSQFLYYSVTRGSTKDMDIPTLNVYVSAEASNEELSAIADSFPDGLEVHIHKGVYRASEDLLSLAINFTIGATASGLFFKLLESGIRKLLNRHKSKINRNIQVRIKKQEKEYIITNDSLFVRESHEQREFQSIDEVFDDLRKH